MDNETHSLQQAAFPGWNLQTLYGSHGVYFYSYPLFMASDADFPFMAAIKVSF